jgi:hypothetical protein
MIFYRYKYYRYNVLALFPNHYLIYFPRDFTGIREGDIVPSKMNRAESLVNKRNCKGFIAKLIFMQLNVVNEFKHLQSST